MIDVFPFADLPVAVHGLDRAGLAAARALHTSGAEVWAWDDDEDRRAVAGDAGVPLVNLYVCDWRELTSLVIGGGIAIDGADAHPVVTRARAAGCEVIGDVELLVRTQRDASFLGVTGIEGRTVTAALLGHILQVSGREAEIGGGALLPALALHGLGGEGAYVLEMAPYDVTLTASATFDVGVLVDCTDAANEAVAAMVKVFHRQTAPRAAVVGVDDAAGRQVFERLKAAKEQVVIPVSGCGRTHGGVYVEGGMLTDDMDGAEVPVTDVSVLAALPGEAGARYAAAAYASARAIGVGPPQAMACIQSFPGLVRHREPLERVDGTLWVNDAAAATPAAAARTLICYDAVHWIAAAAVAKMEMPEAVAGRVRTIHIAEDRDGGLATAVAAAQETARADKGGEAVVVLSPGRVGGGGFADPDALGDAFHDLVEKLPGTHEEA